MYRSIEYRSTVQSPCSVEELRLHGKISRCYTLGTLATDSEAEFLDVIVAKVLRVFLLAIHSHLYSFASRFIFLQTDATSYSFYRKEENLIENHTPSLWFKKSIQKSQV